MSDKKRPAAKDASKDASKDTATKPATLKEAGATQKITKDELEALLKEAQAESGKVPAKKPAPR